MERKDTDVKKYVVRLTPEERRELEAIVHAGKHAAGRLARARILLKADVSGLVVRVSQIAGCASVSFSDIRRDVGAPSVLQIR